MGRYAYGNQPDIAQWNLIRLAETLLPLLAEDHAAAVKEAQQAIGEFGKLFDEAYAAGLRRKLGLLEAQPTDISLAQDLLDRMAHDCADFTLVFRRLCDAAAGPEGDAGVRILFADSSAFDEWATRWRHRLAQEGGEPAERRSAMRAANPAFIPRNHLVEAAIIAALDGGDFRLSKGCCRWFPRLTRITQRAGDMLIHRGPIRSCTKRFAAPDLSGLHPSSRNPKCCWTISLASTRRSWFKT